MKMEQFVYKDKKKLRCGYTTGSCAAAAAKAAAIMLFIGEKIDSVDLLTPGGVSLRLNVEETERNSDSVSCAVRKDAGDDADITDGILIYATVQRQEKQGIEIDGGEGIGRVTRPGLEQSPGSAAINSVPRRMIRDALSEVCDTFGYEGGLKAVIWAPEGTELAKKTFNPNLGVEGGISILGTSGIVEPMS
ncbi:MAG: cobalt-precorrin-5B (C(1))-methyltransferase CbiD, partial [Lachnospiraceae bacterium]